MSTITPMMKQYLEIKSQHKDAILFFRLGDFYEMFFEDAIVATKILEIALTGKNYGAAEKAPMCGVPYHSAEAYIQKLISAGKKVAICEQVEDPKATKGIVKREVLKIITPGTNVNDQYLEGYQDSYLLSITLEEQLFISFIDVTTGEVNAAVLQTESVGDYINQIQPKEILISPDTISKINNDLLLKSEFEIIRDRYTITIVDLDHGGLATEIFGKEELNKVPKGQVQSLDIILGYIKTTQGVIANNIQTIQFHEENQYLKIDPNSKKNLELTQNATTHQKKNSLFDILDYSATSIGKRTLRKWIDKPLNNFEKINNRLDIIEEFNNSFDLRSDLMDYLDAIYDLERITGKMSYGNLNTKDIVALRTSIEVLPKIIDIIHRQGYKNLNSLIANLDDLQDIYAYLKSVIVEEPSPSIKDGEVVRSDYSEPLSEYRYLESNASKILQELEAKEKEKTGIKGLKVGYNKVFGYYFEITHAASKDAKIPENYIRKQTLSNAERFINEDLKVLEDKILGARQKIYEIQADIFEEVRGYLFDNVLRINQSAEIIGKLDALLSLSIASIEHHMVRPQFNKDGNFNIIAARHPVVENILGEDYFVPNDIVINEKSKIQIITGPNMGGKSTYMRQVAILAVMAHMGAFVTAKSANLPLLDAIYTRVGASDDLSMGQSTFMVEMKEVSYILKNATENSLIILDEVGRGTSTFDGMSIAWAIIEYIAKYIKSATLFSTHYHEITSLESFHDNIDNYFIAVDDSGEHINFMHKIMRGKMDKSYGVHVAKIAGLPLSVLKEAEEKLYQLEEGNEFYRAEPKIIKKQPKKHDNTAQISFEDIGAKVLKEKIKSLDLDDISPKQAHKILDDLQSMVKEEML